MVHPAVGHQDGTLLNALLHHVPDIINVPRAGIVHRLDKDTTGLMVVAKTLQSQTKLVEQLQARSVSRIYEAVVVGVITAGATINAPIGRHGQQRQRMAVMDGGKPAVSHYRVLERFRAHTHTRVKLETGRTHQIRVHMAHVGFPLIGDPAYGGRFRIPPAASPTLVDTLKNFPRQALHARRLELARPAGEGLSWLDDEGGASDVLPETLQLAGEAHGELRYGENPHQPARFYAVPGPTGEAPGLDRALVHQGKALSYNNLLDADAALGLVRDLALLGPAAAVIKHVSPCGAALGRAGEGIAEVYRRAREADPESAFGGIVALSQAVDEAAARLLAETFLEVVIAPGFTTAARELLAAKKNLRLLELPLGTGPAGQALRLRSIAGGVLAQREDAIGVRVAAARVVTRRAPTATEMLDLELAQVAGKWVRSNAIVLCKDGVTVGIGGGQTSRVEASRQAPRTIVRLSTTTPMGIANASMVSGRVMAPHPTAAATR